ncbi:geranylgeranyl reductase family protein [Vulcanisaeta distributa]|uniref:Geranylgeranyl reductase n=1 Tax=Vulcanisaeta distributa (strain DSM 14429 / JCM 11212 / NBRC 100878 / IC-017) TaxID=572478 RepID=E1QTA0_VULDI|nr:geranylgeranyl reductase family protein [Vulcanisaeta distributa]ADN50893.1 geranylgeranyl reductase [Vulcanisaeta distributa DSM 14429]
MVNMYDVIVIGAGPSGSMAAYVAAKLGLRVLILDRFRFPRIKPCGGGLTQKSVALLKGLGIELNSVVRDTCKRVIIVNNAGSFLLMDNDPIISIVSRDEFDNYLLSSALEMGADYLVDRIVGVDVHGEYVNAIGMNDTYVSKYVIAADGANSVIARQLGNDIRRGTAMAFMTIAHGNYLNDVCVIDMTRIKWGYSWVFPRGDGEYDVGIGSIRWGDYRTQLIKYVSDVGLREGEVRGHPIPIKARDRIVSKRIALVGDAAGLADPTTGEGIFYAMYSGALAALTLRHSSSPVEFASNYLGIIKPLIKNLSLAYYLSLGTYGIDHLVMGRLGISAFSISSTRNLIKRIMSGSAWYYQVPMSMIKFSVLKGPQVILKGILHG